MSVQSETQDKKTVIHSPVERKSKKWRESRYELAIEIEVSGIDPNGRPYREETRTLDVSEWGCRFTLRRRLERYDLIALRALGVQPYCNAEAGATVYMVARCQEKDGAWQIGASKIHLEKIWDLRWAPPPAEEDPAPVPGDAEAAQYMSVDSMEDRELDALPYGAIQLDDRGVVLKYNRFESEFANRRAEQVIGRNYFREVAPCTAVGEFEGRFLEVVARKKLKQTFAFEFPFQPVARPVVVTMLYSRRTGTTWLFVQPVQPRSHGD